MSTSIKQLVAVIFKNVDGETIRYRTEKFKPVTEDKKNWYTCDSIEHDVLLRKITLNCGTYERVYFVQPPYAFTEQ